MPKPAQKIINGLNEALTHARAQKAPVYATVSQVSPGTVLIADGGFTCIEEGARLIVEADKGGDLFVPCSSGKHLLDGQLDDGDDYVGFTLPIA